VYSSESVYFQANIKTAMGGSHGKFFDKMAEGILLAANQGCLEVIY